MAGTAMRLEMVSRSAGRGERRKGAEAWALDPRARRCAFPSTSILLAQLILAALVCSTNGISSCINSCTQRFDLIGCKSRLLVADAENGRSEEGGKAFASDDSLLAGPLPILFSLGRKAFGGLKNLSLPHSDLWVDHEKRKKRVQDKLYWAARKGRTGKMEELISQGADVHRRHEIPLLFFTPLIYASAFGKINAVNLLIAHNVDVNAAGARPARLPTCMFLTRNADWNQWTPLHWAAYRGQKEHATIAEILIKNGADIHETTWDGRTARSLAEESGQTKIIDLIDKYPIPEML
eukprot:699086-Hanusia_phi.AAC.4